MEVPFHSSGAISRAHYAIVRKIESASSVQTADQHIFLEIKSIQEQLMHPRLSAEKCKECLVILLYCASVVSPGFLSIGTWDFAFTHAINLAEAGEKIGDRRIGYLFCSEMMPLGHKLQLMLINTLRKDLESDNVPRICLGLENLVASPNEDVIPAVQSRLQDLLSHDSPHVKRRALFAIGALSAHDPSLVERVKPVVLRRTKDTDDSVVNAALALLRRGPIEESTNLKTKKRVNGLLLNEWSFTGEINTAVILQLLKTIKRIGLSDSSIKVLFELLEDHAHPKAKRQISKSIVLEVFKNLHGVDFKILRDAEIANQIIVVQAIRHWLSSRKPNESYLFLSCLECVDVALWAGTLSDHPAALDADEFEKIMVFLNSPDQGIFRKTARIVNRVDPGILDTQISLILDLATDGGDLNETELARALELVAIRHEDDGSQYATNAVQLIEKAEMTNPKPRIIKNAVQVVLTTVRNSSTEFSTKSGSQFVRMLADSSLPLGPSLLVITTALTTELADTASTPSSEILVGISERLKTCPVAVQETCLITMLRIAANCENVPNEVTAIISELGQKSRPLVQKRCAQILDLIQKRDKLIEIVNRAASSSLPDFLTALQQEQAEEPGMRSPTPSPHDSRPLSRSSLASSSLRYTAYAPPQVGPRLTIPQGSVSQQSLSSHTASHLGSPPLTAGQLALATGIDDIHIRDKDYATPAPAPPPQATLIDLQAPRADLISLDSPFHAEPLANIEHSENTEQVEDFSEIWHALETGSCDSRGWCNDSIDAITRRLQQFDTHHRLRVIATDVPPFQGELKILMESFLEDKRPGSTTVALRLRDSDEDTCLWRLRCAEPGVGRAVQRLLNGDE